MKQKCILFSPWLLKSPVTNQLSAELQPACAAMFQGTQLQVIFRNDIGGLSLEAATQSTDKFYTPGASRWNSRNVLTQILGPEHKASVRELESS